MKIIDLDKKNENLYFHCLEDWSDEMKESGDRKCKWYEKMKKRGLKVKLAVDENGTVGGMIQYLPVEQSFVEGKDIYFIPCIWVHGHKKGRGDFRGRGMGKALLHAAEEDVRNTGSKGIAAWGLTIPVWMRASWYKKNGYKTVDKYKGMALVLKKFTEDAENPKWIREVKKPGKNPDKVSVVSFSHGWCPGGNIVHERAKRAVKEFGDKVQFTEIDTSDRKTQFEWGYSDALFIDRKKKGLGPPMSYEKIKNKIAKQIKKRGL